MPDAELPRDLRLAHVLGEETSNGPRLPDVTVLNAALRTTPLTRRFAGFLAILALFSIANSSDAFLLLRARELGVSMATIPLLRAALHVSKLVSSYVGSWPQKARAVVRSASTSGITALPASRPSVRADRGLSPFTSIGAENYSNALNG